MKMPTDVVKMYKEVHGWVGILSGLCLFIAFYAGALTMFELPLQRGPRRSRDEHFWSQAARRAYLDQCGDEQQYSNRRAHARHRCGPPRRFAVVPAELQRS